MNGSQEGQNLGAEPVSPQIAEPSQEEWDWLDQQMKETEGKSDGVHGRKDKQVGSGGNGADSNATKAKMTMSERLSRAHSRISSCPQKPYPSDI